MSTYRWTILHVPDVDATVEFYRRAFGFTTARHDPDGTYAELASGETLLAFASHDLILRHHPPEMVHMQSQTHPPAIELAFVVEDLEASYRRALAAGATPQRPPGWMPWGQKVGWIRDNNGVMVQLVGMDVGPPDELEE